VQIGECLGADAAEYACLESALTIRAEQNTIVEELSPSNSATHCEGRSQELNGDLTWRGVYELARPPITASPDLVRARSGRFIISFATRDAAARFASKDDG